MPHDRNAREVKVGDLVNIPGRVIQVFPAAQTCNVQVELLESNVADGTYKDKWTLTARQLELVGAGPELAVPEAAGSEKGA